jgi:hypothetical protein
MRVELKLVNWVSVEYSDFQLLTDCLSEHNVYRSEKEEQVLAKEYGEEEDQGDLSLLWTQSILI